jgi:hypothetical protein
MGRRCAGLCDLRAGRSSCETADKVDDEVAEKAAVADESAIGKELKKNRELLTWTKANTLDKLIAKCTVCACVCVCVCLWLCVVSLYACIDRSIYVLTRTHTHPLCLSFSLPVSVSFNLTLSLPVSVPFGHSLSLCFFRSLLSVSASSALCLLTFLPVFVCVLVFAQSSGSCLSDTCSRGRGQSHKIAYVDQDFVPDNDSLLHMTSRRRMSRGNERIVWRRIRDSMGETADYFVKPVSPLDVSVVRCRAHRLFVAFTLAAATSRAS